MRTYGRTVDVLTGKKTWWVVTTDANGFNDSVYITTLAQVCKLNLGESPFFANYGIPARPSVVLQIYPDYYMVRTQQQFAPYFASLIMISAPIAQGSADSYTYGDADGKPIPRYNFQVLTNYGSIVGVTTAPSYPQAQPI